MQLLKIETTAHGCVGMVHTTPYLGKKNSEFWLLKKTIGRDGLEFITSMQH
jgi:hypothetical protein